MNNFNYSTNFQTKDIRDFFKIDNILYCSNFGLNYVEPSTTKLFSIPKGTFLYHGSLNKESFNPFDIRLGDDRLVSYFSQSKRLAADYIIGCALYPTKSGFLHKFIVILVIFDKFCIKLLSVSKYSLFRNTYTS